PGYPPSWPRLPDRAASPATTVSDCRRSPSCLVSLRAIDQQSGGKALEDLDQHHRAAAGFDNLVADHLLVGIVPALHQYARLDLGDQPDRRVLRKDGDEIDGFQRCQYFGARALVLNGPAITFQPPHGCIAVQAYDQPVAGAACGRQHLDMAWMQDVET